MSSKVFPVLSFTVPFDEADGEGIVFFGNYFRLAHRALEQFLPAIEIPWRDWFNHPEWGVPLRHVEADYLKPLRPGDSFTAHIHVSEIGKSSVHFAYEFRDSAGAPVARLKTSHVFVDRKTLKSREVPASLHEKLIQARL